MILQVGGGCSQGFLTQPQDRRHRHAVDADSMGSQAVDRRNLSWMVVDAWNPAENIASWNGVCFSFQHEKTIIGFCTDFLLPKTPNKNDLNLTLPWNESAVWPPGFHGGFRHLETQQLRQVRGCGDLVVPNWTLWGSKWKLAKRITSSSWRCGFWRFSLENWWVLFSHKSMVQYKMANYLKGIDPTEGSHFWLQWLWEEV